MKGYLIDAGNRQIKPIDYEYGTMKDYLPGGICIAQVFRNGDVLYVDDEALLRPATVAFRVKCRPDGQPMMSNGILTGRDTIDDTADPGMTPEEFLSEIEWLSIEDALKWFRAKGNDPAVVMTTAEGSKTLTDWAEITCNLEGQNT